MPDHEACPDCGGRLRVLGEDVAEMLERVRACFKVIRHVRPKLSCDGCDRIMQAPAPTLPIDRGPAGAGLLAHVLVSKYSDHLPLYRQSEIYAREGVDLDRSTLAGWVGATSELLTPLVQAVRDHVMSASKLHADDTPVPVLAPGTGKTRIGRLRDDRPSDDTSAPAVWFAYSPDRRGENPRQHLKHYKGALQAHAFAGFQQLYEGGAINEVACWAQAMHTSPLTCGIVNDMRTAFILLLFASCAANAQGSELDELLKAGIQAQQQGDYKTAIVNYQRVLKLRPGMADVRANLGAALSHEGRFDEAIVEDQRALKASPASEEIKMNLGLAYYKKGDLTHAEGIFREIQQSMPDNPQIALLLGDSEVRLGQGAAAATMLTPLEPTNRANPDFEYVLGTALIQSGRLREGVARIQKVAEATGAADTYLVAGSTFLDLHDFAHAKTDLEEALRLNSKLPRVYALTGIALDMTGDAADAEPNFREELKRNPDDFDSNLYLGAILYKQRHMNEAKPYLDKALQLNPTSEIALYESSMWESTSGQYEDAAKNLELVVKSNPKWLEPHIELANVYYRLHRPADGARERAIVAELNTQQQSEGPAQP